MECVLSALLEHNEEQLTCWSHCKHCEHVRSPSHTVFHVHSMDTLRKHMQPCDKPNVDYVLTFVNTLQCKGALIADLGSFTQAAFIPGCQCCFVVSTPLHTCNVHHEKSSSLLMSLSLSITIIVWNKKYPPFIPSSSLQPLIAPPASFLLSFLFFACQCEFRIRWRTEVFIWANSLLPVTQCTAYNLFMYKAFQTKLAGSWTMWGRIWWVDRHWWERNGGKSKV